MMVRGVCEFILNYFNDYLGIQPWRLNVGIILFFIDKFLQLHSYFPISGTFILENSSMSEDATTLIIAIT